MRISKDQLTRISRVSQRLAAPSILRCTSEEAWGMVQGHFNPGSVSTGKSGPDISKLFATTLWTGNGTARTITSGIDLLTPGGLIWIKNRTSAYGGPMQDTVRGIGNVLFPSSTIASSPNNSVTALSTTGFSVGTSLGTNASGDNIVGWLFARGLRFFDIQQFTAGTNTNRRISHNLGTVVPGCIIVKRTDDVSDWRVYHVSAGRSKCGYLNSTGAFDTSSNLWGTSDPTTTDFGINEAATLVSGGVYEALIFAHDPAADGVIQCGSFTTDGSGNATVTLGRRPQALLIKCSSAAGDNWGFLDETRGWGAGSDKILFPNTSGTEIANDFGAPTSTGFTYSNAATSTYVYMAIMEP